MLKKNAIATAALLAALASMSPVTVLAADRDGYRGGDSYGFESHSEQSRSGDRDRRKDDGFSRGREQTRFDDDRERSGFRQSDRRRESGRGDRDSRNSHYDR